jgi:multiple antibiotic resistance protein
MSFIDFALIAQMFALVNPLSSFPILMSAYENKMNVKKIAISAIFVALIIAVIIVFIGPALFKFFGITVDSFRIAGGLILLLLGIETVRSKEKHDEGEKVTKTDSVISIMATPLLTGPATISFITIKSYEIGQFPTLFNLLITFGIVAVIFILFSFFISKINAKIVNLTSKVLGLFLTAVAIEMIAAGIEGLIHAAG